MTDFKVTLWKLSLIPTAFLSSPPFPEPPSRGHARRISLAHAEHISSKGVGGKRGHFSPSTSGHSGAVCFKAGLYYISSSALAGRATAVPGRDPKSSPETQGWGQRWAESAVPRAAPAHGRGALMERREREAGSKGE